MIIINQQPGQLGNCLMLWSHVIAYGIENNIHVSNPRFLQYANDFENVDKNFCFLYPPLNSLSWLSRYNDYFFKLIPYINKVASLLESKEVRYIILDDFYNHRYSLEDLTKQKELKKKLVLINGWQFRAENLVVKHRKYIVDFFRPKEHYLERIKDKFTKLRTDDALIVGVHIRKGDYMNFHKGRFYYDDKVYYNILLHFLSLVNAKSVLFLICSNEAVDLNAYRGLDVKLSDGNTVEDLLSLASCDYIIGPPSSYSIWASYYGEVPTYHIEDPAYSFTKDNFYIKYNLDIEY